MLKISSGSELSSSNVGWVKTSMLPTILQCGVVVLTTTVAILSGN